MIEPRIDQVGTIFAERSNLPEHDSKCALGRLRTWKDERRAAIDRRPRRSDRQLRVEAASQYGGFWAAPGKKSSPQWFSSPLLLTGASQRTHPQWSPVPAR